MARWDNAACVCLTASIFCRFQRITNQAIGGQFLLIRQAPKKRGIAPFFYPSKFMPQEQFAQIAVLAALSSVGAFDFGISMLAEIIAVAEVILLPEFFFFIVEHFPACAEFL